MITAKVSGRAGLPISVELANQAYVYLMDESNHRSFQNSRNGRGTGGWYVESPAQFVKPDGNDWYVVIYDRNNGHPAYKITTG